MAEKNKIKYGFYLNEKTIDELRGISKQFKISMSAIVEKSISKELKRIKKLKPVI